MYAINYKTATYLTGLSIVRMYFHVSADTLFIENGFLGFSRTISLQTKKQNLIRHEHELGGMGFQNEISFYQKLSKMETPKKL